jgi:hypothetical protein
MRELHKTNGRLRGRVLRQLLIQTRKLESMPEGVVRRLLRRACEQPLSDQDSGG